MLGADECTGCDAFIPEPLDKSPADEYLARWRSDDRSVNADLQERFCGSGVRVRACVCALSGVGSTQRRRRGLAALFCRLVAV